MSTGSIHITRSQTATEVSTSFDKSLRDSGASFGDVFAILSDSTVTSASTAVGSDAGGSSPDLSLEHDGMQPTSRSTMTMAEIARLYDECAGSIYKDCDILGKYLFNSYGHWDWTMERNILHV
ncbi:hypothetical protein EC988_001092 [Linderina pennispora]|nr:hypothetical protein EC988_001092 [Linderina pennispora]